jgi:hypothetical protein
MTLLLPVLLACFMMVMVMVSSRREKEDQIVTRFFFIFISGISFSLLVNITMMTSSSSFDYFTGDCRIGFRLLAALLLRECLPGESRKGRRRRKIMRKVRSIGIKLHLGRGS